MNTNEEDPLRSVSSRVLEIIRVRTGLLPHLAAPIRDDILSALRHTYGSERIYIRSRDPDRRARLRASLRQQWDGTGARRDQLCREHHISRRTFYRLMKSDNG